MDDPPFKQKLYGRRKGPKFSAHQARLMQALLPQLALDLEPGRDPKSYFGMPVSDVWLEIGFGSGEHLLWQARANPDIGLIGAEPYVSGVAKLLSKLAPPSASPEFHSGSAPPPLVGEERAGRLRLYTDDARNIIGALPDSSIGRVFILYPDPWPKSRHHKRRFIQMEMLNELARILRAGAELRFATDARSYLAWALERLTVHPAFAWLAQSPEDWRARPSDWPETRYEAKALRQGRNCAHLRFARR